LAVYNYADPSPCAKPSNEVTSGWNIWQQKNCNSFHQLYGLGGYMGPDLTNTASIKGKEYMKVFIRYGSGKMPNFHLNKKEVNDLISFLEWVDKTGLSKVPDSAVHWTGTYSNLKQ